VFHVDKKSGDRPSPTITPVIDDCDNESVNEIVNEFVDEIVNENVDEIVDDELLNNVVNEIRPRSTRINRRPVWQNDYVVNYVSCDQGEPECFCKTGS